MYYDQQSYMVRRIQNSMMHDNVQITSEWVISLLNSDSTIFESLVAYTKWADNCPSNYKITPEARHALQMLTEQSSLVMSCLLNYLNRRGNSYFIVKYRTRLLNLAELNERFELTDMPEDLGKSLMLFKLEKG